MKKGLTQDFIKKSSQTIKTL